MTNGSLMKVESIAECSLENSAILLTCIKRLKNNFPSFLEWPFYTGLTVFVEGSTKQKWIIKPVCIIFSFS